jgi:hypothetical protein
MIIYAGHCSILWLRPGTNSKKPTMKEKRSLLWASEGLTWCYLVSPCPNRAEAKLVESYEPERHNSVL